MEDMEALGPFASWRPARSYGAVGNGIADDTAALQRAIDQLVQTGAPKVLHLQAGTYRITSSLVINATAGTYGLSLIGDHPATTRIVWDGPAGAPMLIANGGVHTSFSRITWDGRSKAGYGVAHWWQVGGPLFGGSAEHADEVFVDIEIGIMGGRLGAAYGQLDSEGQVRRVKFIRNTKAGLNVGSWNALNWWVWDSQFTDCGRGVTNKFTVSDDVNDADGAGSFVVYRSLFERSKVADAEIGNTGTFGVYASTSIGSRRFFHSDRVGLNTARETLQGNRVLDTTDPVAVYNGNVGPLNLIDNEFRSLFGATGPVVMLDNTGVGTDVVSVGNLFTVASPIAPRDGQNRVLSIGDRVVDRITIPTRLPVLPGVPERSSRRVFEVARGAGGAAIQAAIDAAVAAAAAGVVNPVVHLPSGDYVLDRTLTVPANTRLQIAGDSIGTQIYPALPADAPMLYLAGPSQVTVRDLRLNGRSQQAIVIDNADQEQGRILVVGSTMGPISATRLLGTILSMQANTSVLAMDLSGVAGALSLGTGGFGPLTLRQDSHFLMSDSWYEGAETRLFRLESGRLTVRNSVVAPADPVHGGGPVEPLIAFDAFRGSATLLGVDLNIQNAGNGVRIGQIGADSQAMLLGIKANKSGFFTGGTNVGEVGLMLSREPAATGLESLLPLSGIGHTGDDFVVDMLSQARSIVWDSAPVSAPAGATDVRIYRVMTTDAGVGMRVTGAAEAQTLPELSVASLKADMTGPHEAAIVGVPPAWSWGSAADPGYGLTGYPSSWTSPAYTMWGIVGPAASGSPATNVRVQIRHLRADFKRNGVWYRAQSEKNGFSGANYTDYTTNASTPANVIQLGDEGLAVKVIQSGGHYHFYPANRVPFPRDLQALVVSMDTRLVKDNPNGIDDIDSARIYGVAAGDVYQSMTASWNGSTWVNGHAPVGRFRQLGRNWRTITAHLGMSTDAQFNEYIAWTATQPR